MSHLKNSNAQYWAVVPAAGIGNRMKSSLPKQYLSLGTTTILDATLTRLLSLPAMTGLVLSLAPDDRWWPNSLFSKDSRVHTVIGGRERADSVFHALRFLRSKIDCDPWVLVHDAARPCVRSGDICRLMTALRDHEVGGILAVPASDTLKCADGQNSIRQTLDRRAIWQAQTPQMFRLDLLQRCLATCLNRGDCITDEASAVEACGYRPLLVEGHTDNIKITRPEDLPLAAFILSQQTE